MVGRRHEKPGRHIAPDFLRSLFQPRFQGLCHQEFQRRKIHVFPVYIFHSGSAGKMQYRLLAVSSAAVSISLKAAAFHFTYSFIMLL